jgi:hypothetical protein
MAAITECRIAHQTPVRLRLVVQGPRRDRAFFEALRERLSKSTPATRVHVNPTTSSIVIHSRDSDAMLDRLRRGDALTIVGEPERIVTPRRKVDPSPFATAADAQIRRWSGGRLDAKSVSAVAVLIVILTVKLARGNPTSAAMLLLLYAGGKVVRRRLAIERQEREPGLIAGEGAA